MRSVRVKYKDWYNQGVKNGYMKKYTINLIDGMMKNNDLFMKSLTPSVLSKLGKYEEEKMTDRFWIFIQRDMMTNDKYWEEIEND